MNQLMDLIRKKRNEMIHLGLTKGFCHEATIQCSQQLDELLNKLTRMGI